MNYYDMENESIQIRNAEISDIKGMVHLLFELFQLEDDFSFNELKQKKGLELLLNENNSSIFVAEYEKEVIGMITIQKVISTAEGEFVGLVEDFIIKNAFRKKGVGSKLLKVVIQWAENNMLARIQLLADKNNRDALQFYYTKNWHFTNLICLRKMIEL